MATELATAYVQIIPTTKDIKSSLEKELTPAGESAGASAGSKIGSAIKKALVAAGIGDVIKKALGEGMDLQQNLGGTEAVFGEFAKNIQATASEAYKNMGMSASEYMATANKMGALFQGSGLAQQESLDLTAKAMQRAADVASVMGLDTTAAMESIAGAAKGNFTMMDNLGVSMNATTLQAYALEKGVNFKWDTASNAEKAELAMQMFFERTEQYAGNFARESSETLSGSLNAVKASFSDLLGNLALGNDITPSLEALKSTVTVFVKDNLVPALGNVISGAVPILADLIVDLLPDLAAAALQLVDEIGAGLSEKFPQLSFLFDNLRPIVEGVTIAFVAFKAAMAISSVVETLTGVINGAKSAFSALTAVMNANPFVLVATLVAGLVTALITLWNTNEGFRTAVQNIWAAITGFFSQAWETIKGVWSAVTGFFSGIWNGIKGVFSSVGSWFSEKFTAAKEAASNAWSNIKSKFSQHWENIKGAFSSAGSWFTSNFQTFRENAVNAWSNIKSRFSDVWNRIKSAFSIGDALAWGRDMLQNFINGIGQKISALVAKVKGIGQTIRNFLGFSEPKMGPLHNFHTFAPDMMKLYAQGMTQNTGLVTDAAKGVAAEVAGINPTMGAVSLAEGMDDIARQTASAAWPAPSVTPSAIPADGQGGIMAQLLAAVLALSDKLDNMAVYLDSDALVGRLISKIDAALGRRQALEARGGVG